MPRFQPERVLAALKDAQVDFVVIGGVGATLHGSPLRTIDTDICPSRAPENLRRLAHALVAMTARIRAEGAPDGLPFACDERFLASVSLLNLTTDFGDLDLCFEPAGTGGYAELVGRRVEFDLEGLIVPVASLADIVRSKEASGRPKDLAALPTLRALLQRQKT